MRPERTILMTADTVGGVWTYALELVRALGSRSRVILAAMGALPSRDQRAAAREAGAQLVESRFSLEWMQDPWDDVDAASEWLLKLEGRFRPDLIHLNNFAHGALPWKTPVLVVGHSCVFSWWDAVFHERPPAEWDEYHARVRAGLAAADMVAAPTAAMLASLRRHYGPMARERVVYNGIAAADCRPGEKQPLVFSAGRVWDKAKNIAALAKVARRLQWPIFVAGDPSSPDGHSLCLKDVYLLGRLPPRHVHGWMSRATVYALPARYEPFGLSALEAALCGCALVLGDIPSLREVWGDAALYVDPEDDDALEAALSIIIEDRDLQEALAWRALQRAQRYTAARMARGYEGVYATLAGAAARHE